MTMDIDELKMPELVTQAEAVSASKGKDKDKPAPKQRGYEADYFTDTYLGEALAEELADRALFLPEEKTWLIYNPAGYWEQDRTEQVAVQAKEWVKKLNHEVKENGNGAEQVNAGRYLARRNREALVKEAGLAKSVVSTTFDTQNDHLLVANGKVDLRTGALEPVQPEDRFRKHSRVEYDPKAKMDLWGNVLKAFPDDAHEWLQVVVGQALTGYMPSDGKTYFLKGDGKNGKSTVLDCLKEVAGSVASQVDNSLLLNNKGGGASPEKMALNGLRLGFLEELPEDNFLNAKMLKEVAGTPEVTARPLFGNYITFANRATLFITTNHLPKVAETDHGTWRRLIAIPTPYRFIKRSEMPDGYVLGEFERWVDEALIRPKENVELLKQALAWAIRGSMKWYANNRVDPVIPPSVEAFTKAWLGREDKVGAWFDDCLEVDDNSMVLAMDAYDSYKEYTLAHGQKVEAYQSFLDKFAASSRVKEAKLEAKKTTWTGLTQSKFTPTQGKQRDDAKPREAGKIAVVIKNLAFRVDGEVKSLDQAEKLAGLEQKRAELEALIQELDGKIILERTRDENVDDLLNDDDLLDEPIY